MITRDNYEEFFLLYTDNELSAAERHEVEKFVADHPDLREEWESLLQCRISPETHLAFPDREALLKPESEDSAYARSLVYYVDGLPFLHPDTGVVFSQKDSLYRTAKDRRVIPLPWLRAGIAAAVIGAIALVFLLTTGSKLNPPSPSAKTQTTIDKKITPAVTSAAAPALHLTEGQPKPKPGRAARTPIKPKPEPQQGLAVNNRANEEPTAVRTTVDPPKGKDQPSSDVSVGNVPVTESLAANVHLAVQTGIPKDQSSFATQALQEEQAADGRENDLGPDEPAAPSRTKLRGIFRKVKRVFGKTAERDSDGNRQVLVGAFEVSLD
jgi:hypothetical protein